MRAKGVKYGPNLQPGREERLVKEFKRSVVSQASLEKYQFIYTNLITFIYGPIAAIYVCISGHINKMGYIVFCEVFVSFFLFTSVEPMSCV